MVSRLTLENTGSGAHHRAMTSALAFVVVFVSTCSALANPTARALFDGKTLEGWEQKGGSATFRVEDGVIVGETVPRTPNSFLCTKKHYADFILEYEFKVDEELNSGVQIRSNSLPEYRNGQVHGYQVEIDPDQDSRKHRGVERPRLWTGGIYEEGRRGWLNDLFDNAPARKAFKPGDWNHVKVHAEGDWIRTWVNGVPAADLRDSMTLSGFVALQVHGIGTSEAGPWQVRWRNLKITDLGKHEWKPLFDGKSLEGWKPLPGGEWKVEEGKIVGRSPKSERRHGILLNDREFENFALRAKFRVHSGDSGFYFRCEPVKGGVSVHGFQVEVDDSQETGGLYETGGRGWVVKPTECTDPKEEIPAGRMDRPEPECPRWAGRGSDQRRQDSRAERRPREEVGPHRASATRRPRDARRVQRHRGAREGRRRQIDNQGVFPVSSVYFCLSCW